MIDNGLEISKMMLTERFTVVFSALCPGSLSHRVRFVGSLAS